MSESESCKVISSIIIMLLPIFYYIIIITALDNHQNNYDLEVTSFLRGCFFADWNV